MKINTMIMLVASASIILLSGCNKGTKVEEAAAPLANEPAPYEEDEFAEYDEYEEYEDYPEEEYYDEEIPEEEEALPEKENKKDNSMAVGVWYTDGYDVDSNWAGSYRIELTSDGKASCTGWRNKDTGTFEITGDDKVLITLDKCETDSPGEGFVPVEGFKYTIEMTVKGDDANIKIKAPDVISNLEDGAVHRQSGNAQAEEGDEGESVDIADGEYITDEKYKGEISSDGATLSINTALSHYDKDWNTVLDYEKRTYVFTTSKNCKCVIYQEDVEQYPVSKQIDFINEFLKGNSGLPITLKIKNNELIEIGFSS